MILIILMIAIGIIIGIFLDRFIPTKEEKIEKEYIKIFEKAVKEDLEQGYKVKKRIRIRYEELLKLNDKDFKLQTGITKENFNHMLEILKDEYEKAHVNGSNKGIGYECRLVLAISYWREYRGMRQMAFDYEIALSTVCSSIHWVEDILSKHQDFTFGTIDEEISKLEKEGKK